MEAGRRRSIEGIEEDGYIVHNSKDSTLVLMPMVTVLRQFYRHCSLAVLALCC